MMLGDKYGLPLEAGLLLYLKTGDSIGVPLVRDEVRALILARNELAAFITDHKKIPQMLRSPMTCGRCFQLKNCSLTHRALENGTAETSGLGGVFEQSTGHLTEDHLEYFREWYHMISIEYRNHEQKDLWALSSWDRERKGDCFSHMTMVPRGDDNQGISAVGPREHSLDKNGHSTNELSMQVYRFRRHCSHPLGEYRESLLAEASSSALASSTTGEVLVSPRGFGGARDDASSAGARDASSLLDVGRLGVGDRVLISSEDGHKVAMATGKIVEIAPDAVAIESEARLETSVVASCEGDHALRRDVAYF